MVNPILATIIKKAIKGGMTSQYGGDGSEGNEKLVGAFLSAVIISIIGEFIGADYLAKSAIESEFKNLSCNNNQVSEQTTSAAEPTTGAAEPTTGAAEQTTSAAEQTTSNSKDTFANITTGASSNSETPEELDERHLKAFRKQIYLIYIPLLFVNIGLIVGLYMGLKKGGNNSVKQLFTVSFIVMISSIIISYIIKCSKSKKVLYFSEYIGVKGYTPKEMGIGMVTNIIFGFIDNFGLFFGMDSLDDFLNFDRNQAGGGSDDDEIANLQTAGWGNTFSDFLGAFVGNAVGDSISTLANVERSPIISEIIGIVIGCVLGVYIPAEIKKADTVGGKLLGAGKGFLTVIFLPFVSLFNLFTKNKSRTESSI
jgi:hypothetical protein